MTAVNLTHVWEALRFGLEYHGHELDDVTGIVYAVSEDAKKFDRGLAQLARAEAVIQAARELVPAGHVHGWDALCDALASFEDGQ